MQLMINGEQITGDIYLVEVGQTRRRGLVVRDYEYEAVIKKGTRKIVKRFKTYEACRAYLMSLNKEEKSEARL